MRPTIDKETEHALRIFLKHIESKYPISEAILFGSRARGTHAEDSDADLAVILKGKTGDHWAIGSDLARLSFDVMLETGILVQALPIWETQFEEPESFTNPKLIANIKRDGLRL